METLVDTNILLDILINDPVWFERSLISIETAQSKGVLVLSPVVYSEVASVFQSKEELDSFFSPEQFRWEQIPWPAYYLAGVAFSSYLKRVRKRNRILPDFLIAAHAAVGEYHLLTRDQGFYRDYFQIKIISP
jgi:predicted nucleic acid-binding protein